MIYPRLAAMGLLFASSAVAQYQFLPIQGPKINPNGVNAVYTVDLGFNFTMPGGTVVTQVAVDTECRIVQVGTVGPDTSESTAEMTNNATASINVKWDSTIYDTSESRWPPGLFFSTDNATVAWVTWCNVSVPEFCTVQCQLYASGEIVMVYEGRMGSDDGIVGVCPGFGATLPAQLDLSTASVGSPLATGDPTAYQGAPSVNWFDLQARALAFSPIGAGGVGGWVITGNAGVADAVHPFATSVDIGGGCFQKRSYVYAPDGLGGYSVSSNPSLFDSSIGAPTGAVADQLYTFDLGFPMLFPDGSTHQLVNLDPNGIIMPATASLNLGPPDANDLIVGVPLIFGLWTDWDTGPYSISDGIYWKTVPGSSATFTWNSVAQYRPWGTTGTCTWQVTLLNGGTVIITHEEISSLNQSFLGSDADRVAVGVTSGVGPLPSEIDHLALPTATAGFAYEFWNSQGAVPIEPFTLRHSTPKLVSVNRLVHGQNWEVQAQGSGSALFGIYLVGLSSINVGLEFLGSPCTLLSSNDFLQSGQVTDGFGNISPFVFPLGLSPDFTGVDVIVQCAIETPIGGDYSGFAGLPWAFSLTNALKCRVGTL